MAPALAPAQTASWLFGVDDPLNLDEPVALSVIAAELPSRRRGRKTSTSVVYRWAKTGCRGRVLRHIQCGSIKCTTRRWVREFFEALTEQSQRQAGSLAADDLKPAPLSKDHRNATKELEMAGI